MKRLTALFIALILMVIPVSATSGSYFDYTDDILENGDLIYYFQEMSLQLPAEWRGKVMAEQQDGGVSFYQTSSHQKYLEENIKNGGFLFQLGASVNQSFTQLPKFEYLGFSEDTAMNYYLRLPTDYPAYPEKSIQEEYDDMIDDIDYVVEHAEFYANKNNQGGADSVSTYQDDASDGMTAGQPGTDTVVADDADDADDTPAWTPQQVRYSFEHSMMPRYFYDRPTAMLDAIYKNGFYPLWNVVCTENKVNPTYPEKDYIMHWYYTDENAELVQIELPDPDSPTLCYRIYFVYGPGENDATYYTLESDDFEPDTTFLCTWDKDRNHKIINTFPNLDKTSSGYQDKLKEEAEMIARMSGINGSLKIDSKAKSVTNITDDKDDDDDKDDKDDKDDDKDDKNDDKDDKDDDNLQEIECPQQGFSVEAQKNYSWDYQVGTGISIYTGTKGSIPYVIVYQGEDLIVEAYEYIKEQYTPYMQEKYGANLVSFEETETYEIGGRKLPAGIYSYKLGDYTIEQVRIYDSTGKATVAYTAKYIKGEGDETLKALDTAVRTFEAEEADDLPDD